MAVKRTIYLCIGGNLGEREANLEETRMFLEFNFGDIVAVSSVYESDAWGMHDAPRFLNQVVCIESDLSNEALLSEIEELEEFYGRERSEEEYLSREMDVDVLLIDQEVIDDDKLKVPHPRMEMRRFVLLPLQEIAPDLMHPVLRKNVTTLLSECTDTTQVSKV
jgi:2-amino-4-hydroxy-6-hydroxymethyldihydropteridine diphosphokinase